VYYNTEIGMLGSIEPYIKTSDEYAEEFASSIKIALTEEPSHKLIVSTSAASNYTSLLTLTDIDELCEALKKDITSIKPEDYYNSTTVCTLEPEYLYSKINIKSCYTNTLSFLEKNGLDKDFLSKNPTNLEDRIVELYPNVISAETIYNGITDETKYIIHDNIEYFGEASTLGSVSNIDIDKCADKIRELLEVSKPYSKKSEVCGVIAVDSTVYYVPIEYKDKVAEIYNKYKLEAEYRINEYGDFYLKYDDYVHETYIDILPGFFRNDIGVYKYNESGEKVYIFKYDESQYYN